MTNTANKISTPRRVRATGLHLVALMLWLAFQVQATTYYIATNGADGNSGTDVNHPWAPDTHAWTSITANSVVGLNSTNLFTNICFWCTVNNVLWTSYGSSNTIVSNNLPGANLLFDCAFTNLSGIVLSNLYLDAPRPDTNGYYGAIQDNGQCGTVYFIVNSSNNTMYANDTIIFCRVTGTTYPIYWNPTYVAWPDGFTNWVVFGNTISNGAVAGLTTQVSDWGSGNPIIPTHPEMVNGIVASNDISKNLGFTAYTSGFGASLYCCNGLKAIGNRIYMNGASNNWSGSGGGPGGYFIVSSENCYTFSNEVFSNYSRTAGQTIDGNGLGADTSAISNTFACNYVHDNQGDGMYDYGGPNGAGKNVFKFNYLSNNAYVYGQEIAFSECTNNSAYNNTVISKEQALSTSDTGDGFTNNIFVTPNQTLTLNGCPFINNIFYTNGAANTVALPPWMNTSLQLYFNGPGVLSAYYIPGNGSVDYWGTNIDNYSYNVGAVNSTWGGSNPRLGVKAPQFGP
jgi:hypothetical protein